MSGAPERTRRRGGFSYAEVLVAVALVAMALVPALEALEIGVEASGIHGSELERHYRLAARLEEVLARPFAELVAEEQAAAGAPSAYSDATGPERRLILLSGFDANGDGSPDPGILRVRAEIEATDHRLETLAVQ